MCTAWWSRAWGRCGLGSHFGPWDMGNVRGLCMPQGEGGRANNRVHDA